MAALIMTGIVRLYDYVDPRGAAYQSNFNVNSIQQIVRGMQVN